MVGHVWCIWSRCVHIRTRQRAGLWREARLRVRRPRVQRWALRWQHGHPEAELSCSVPGKGIGGVIHETSDLYNAGIYSGNKKMENLNVPLAVTKVHLYFTPENRNNSPGGWQKHWGPRGSSHEAAGPSAWTPPHSAPDPDPPLGGWDWSRPASAGAVFEDRAETPSPLPSRTPLWVSGDTRL